MSNHHLRNAELSLKAKGSLSPHAVAAGRWDYTTKGSPITLGDGVNSITTALKELERHGYLTRAALRYTWNMSLTVLTKKHYKSRGISKAYICWRRCIMPRQQWTVITVPRSTMTCTAVRRLGRLFFSSREGGGGTMKERTVPARCPA